MTTPQIDTYRDSAADLLEQARTELAAGDVRQASEKGWGAAAQSVKAIAEARELGASQPRGPVPGRVSTGGGNRR